MMTLMTDVGAYPYESRPSYDSYHSHHSRHRHFYTNSETEYLQNYVSEREEHQTRTRSVDSSVTSLESVASGHYSHDNHIRFVDKIYIKKIQSVSYFREKINIL